MTVDGVRLSRDLVELQLRRAARRGLGPKWLAKFTEGVRLSRLVPTRAGYYQGALREIARVLRAMRTIDGGAPWFEGDPGAPEWVRLPCAWCKTPFSPCRRGARFCTSLCCERFHRHRHALRLSAAMTRLAQLEKGAAA